MAYRIRELREKKKLTQEQLAQMSGVTLTSSGERIRTDGLLHLIGSSCRTTFQRFSMATMTISKDRSREPEMQNLIACITE